MESLLAFLAAGNKCMNGSLTLVFYRGQETEIGAGDGLLPGVPGQPMSRAEVQGMKERMIRALEGHIQKHGNPGLEEEKTDP